MDLTLLYVAHFLAVKFNEAEKYLPQAEAAFRMVEQAIIDNHGEEEGRK